MDTVVILLVLLVLVSLGGHWNIKPDGNLLSALLVALNVNHINAGAQYLRKKFSSPSDEEIAREGNDGIQKV